MIASRAVAEWLTGWIPKDDRTARQPRWDARRLARRAPTVSVTVPATRAMRKRLLADFYKARGLDLSEDARADFMRLHDLKDVAVEFGVDLDAE